MVTRQISIIYNGYTLPNQIDKFTISEDYNEIHFSADFVITASSVANLVTACNTAEAALREKNKAFSLSYGSAEYSFSHSSNTGFLAWPSIEKVPDKLSTETARHYKFSMTCQRPADQSGYGYRRDGRIEVGSDEWKRLVISFSGTYTAGSTNSAYTNYANGTTGAIAWATAIAAALLPVYDIMSLGTYSYEQENKLLDFSGIVFREREQNIEISYDTASRRVVTLSGSFSDAGVSTAIAVYNATCPAWAAAVIADITGTFERISKQEAYDQNKKILRFTWIYQEIIADESIGGTSDKIKDVDIAFSLHYNNRVDTSVFHPNRNATTPAMATCSFSAWVDKDEIATNAEAESFYNSDVRRYLISRIKIALNMGSRQEVGSYLIVLNEELQWNESRHHLTGTISLMTGEAFIVEHSEKVIQRSDPGTVYEKLWDGIDNSYAAWGIGAEVRAEQIVKISQFDWPAKDPESLGGNWEAVSAWIKDESVENLGHPGNFNSAAAVARLLYTTFFRRSYLFVAEKKSASRAETTDLSLTTTGKAQETIAATTDTGSITASGQQRSK